MSARGMQRNKQCVRLESAACNASVFRPADRVPDWRLQAAASQWPMPGREDLPGVFQQVSPSEGMNLAADVVCRLNMPLPLLPMCLNICGTWFALVEGCI